MTSAPTVSPSSDNPVRLALNWAAGRMNILARSVPTFGHSPDPGHFRSRAELIKTLAKEFDAVLVAIGAEGALHTHDYIPAEDYTTVCQDGVYDHSLAERFELAADRLRDERREASR